MFPGPARTVLAVATLVFVCVAGWLRSIRGRATARLPRVIRRSGPVSPEGRRDRASFSSGGSEPGAVRHGDTISGRARYPAWCPSVVIRQDPGMLVIRTELDGISDDELDVEVYDDAIVVVGGWIRDAASGSFCRSVRVPREIDRDHVAATFRDEVLTILAPVGPRPGERRNGE
ncbi:MAG TPA: Hsp20 family protein [Methylomirabilota bacterium]|nr:Hsp20 family protein [Methylomirabilota bacterium]